MWSCGEVISLCIFIPQRIPVSVSETCGLEVKLTLNTKCYQKQWCQAQDLLPGITAVVLKMSSKVY